MMRKSKHKLEKELKREERHKEWIRKNLRNTDIERKNQKKLLLLYTKRVSDLLCMSKSVHVSPTKEHDDDDNFQQNFRRAA